MRKGDEMTILLLACAGGILAALVAVVIETRRMKGYRDRLDRHLKWHDMEATNRIRAVVVPEKKAVTKKPTVKKAVPIKGGKKA